MQFEDIDVPWRSLPVDRPFPNSCDTKANLSSREIVTMNASLPGCCAAVVPLRIPTTESALPAMARVALTITAPDLAAMKTSEPSWLKVMPAAP